LPTYPIEPDKLLDAADRLAPAVAGRGRPPYTAHRRAVSTAYYAVFHAITGRVVETVFPSADDAFRHRVRRWIGHGDIRNVAGWVSQLQGTKSGTPPPHIAALLSPAGGPPYIDADTVTIADGFLELNDKREQADYDHDAVFPRRDALTHIALAQRVVTVAYGAQSDEALLFFGLIGMQARVQAR
jgi:hypothetical protein